MSLRRAYRTNKELEKSGVERDFGHCVLTLRRSDDRKFLMAVAEAMKPFQLQMQNNAMSASDTAKVDHVVMRVFVSHLVTNWQTRRSDGSLAPGIEGPDDDPDGELLRFTVDNAADFLLEFPDFFKRVEAECKRRQVFLASLEAARGN